MQRTTVDGRNILVMVPDENVWLSKLYAAMLKAGIAVEDVVLQDKSLRVSVVSPETEPLLLVVRPATSPFQGWRKTDRFVLGYEGTDSIPLSYQKDLGLFWRILCRFEQVMPPQLDGYAFVGNPAKTPQESLIRVFPFITIERLLTNSGDLSQVLIRTTSRCNQNCPFCSGPKHEEPSCEVVSACLESISDMLPGAYCSLTGGEPTLKRSFRQEVEKALSLADLGQIQVQTNAVNFGRKLDPRDLPRHERLSFFVSLHALDPNIYDACTGSRGMLQDAVSGVQQLLAAGHRVVLNVVVNIHNISHLMDMVQWIPEHFHAGAPPALHFSIVMCPEWNARASDCLVKYSELVPVLHDATRQAKQLGITVDSLLSSTHASLPPCLVPQEYRTSRTTKPAIGRDEVGYEDDSRQWVKAATCRSCSENAHCVGVPRPYAARFGLGELKPLSSGG